jgi:hypothetical protein
MQPHSRFEPEISFRDKTRKAAASLALLSVTAFAVFVFLPIPASAALGEASTSTEADRISMKASMRMVRAAKYTVHEIQTPSGTTLREYVSAAGSVFAVAWQGPVMPDLRQALGAYFDRYTASARAAKHASRRHIAVRESDFVVQSSGHMRAFSGRAYVPQLMPQGVAVEEIR